MKLLFIFIASLMMFAPKSFAQKDHYSAINAKNCGADAFYEAPGSSGQDTMREAHEKDREDMLRKIYWNLSKEERSGWSEDTFVEA